jgi:tetratricopeptide (TPR) repeat protein
MIVSRILILALVPALLGPLWPSPGPVELVRRGNTAFHREDYERAAAAYAQAAERLTDPGLAAFNRAGALYRQGRYREAELVYRCCLEDAAGWRRIHALVGLGNAQVQQGPERGAGVLREAIRRYEECLREDGLDPDLVTDVRHNLELAKLLLVQALARPQDPPSSPPDAGQESPRPQGQRDEPRDGGEQPGPGGLDPRGDRVPVQRQPGMDPQATEEPAPGAGQLPPVPDQEEMAPLSREDAENHLRRAAARILSDYKAHQQQRRGKGKHGHALDW